MPCTGGPCGDNSDNTHLIRTINELEKKNTHLEACLCAIITELETKEIAGEIILNAGKRGQVNIAKFWNEHKKDDQARLTADMRKYSQHELDIIKNKILK